jgi:hypothetical protein
MESHQLVNFFIFLAPLNLGVRAYFFLYTDPGTGAYLWQLCVAAVFGLLFYKRALIRRVGHLFSSVKRPRDSSVRVAETSGKLSGDELVSTLKFTEKP